MRFIEIPTTYYLIHPGSEYPDLDKVFDPTSDVVYLTCDYEGESWDTYISRPGHDVIEAILVNRELGVSDIKSMRRSQASHANRITQQCVYCLLIYGICSSPEQHVETGET